MGRTEVQAKVIGDRETREYTFLIDTGATYLALPVEEIEKVPDHDVHPPYSL